MTHSKEQTLLPTAHSSGHDIKARSAEFGEVSL